jgi:hypothetical protein
VRYGGSDLEGWEFKIVRSNTKRFRKPEAVRELCAEEAKAGWEMLEKFDDGRIRFKRRVEKRSGDRHLAIDPYRTLVGPGEVQLAMSILGVMALAGLAAGLLAWLLR